MVKKSLPIPISREQLTNNGLYKIVAFVVAFSVWVTMLYGRKEAISIHMIGVEFLLPNGLTLTESSPQLVEAKVAGRRAALKKFEQTTRLITIDLTSETTGKKTVFLDDKYIGVPTSVKLLSVEPDRFEIEIVEEAK